VTNYIILALCILVLLSYLFDITSRYSKIPSVILLIGLGILIRILIQSTDIKMPDLEPLLPLFGTLGLILIVMEASLDLKLGRNKTSIIIKSASAAIILFALFVIIMTFVMVRFIGYRVTDSLLNAIPFGIISSAVAISSAANLNQEQKEFIVYESSLSDILGILVFNFILVYGDSIGHGLISFTLKGILTILVAAAVTFILAILLHKITYHINYVIILTALILVYVLGELIHLPALLLVLAFGIALANNRLIENTWAKRFIDFEKFRTDLSSFKMIMAELTFVIRSFFFIMFGYYTQLDGLFDLKNLITALSVIGVIYLLRIIFLSRFLKVPLIPYLFFSPRGLITILLFLSIPANSRLQIINEEVLTLVILITILLMTFGNLIIRREHKVPVEVKIGSEGEVTTGLPQDYENQDHL
jgi:Kef-type K+ transport system membrane component KefB